MSHYNLEEKENLLKTVSQEAIFSLVFGFEPIENQYVCSVFRPDTTPGCWFSYHEGKLWFVDFANENVYRHIKMSHLDCFAAVQVYYNLPNFQITLNFIQRKIQEGAITASSFLLPRPKIVSTQNVTIQIAPKPFTDIDKQYWSPYGISSKQLMSDNVFAVNRFKMLNTKVGDLSKAPSTNCYAFTGFTEAKKKLYFPYRKGKARFLTNCKASDVGELDTLPESGDTLIISKSYKDARVLRNQGLSTVWFQNEGMLPKAKLLAELGKRFKKIVVFFDNDAAGITASYKVRESINQFFPSKSSAYHLPQSMINDDITDPSDLIKKYGKAYFNQFLQQNLLSTLVD